MTIPSSLHDLIQAEYGLALLLILLGGLVLHLLVARLLHKLQARRAAAATLWEKVALGALTLPALVMIWLGGALLALQMVAGHLPDLVQQVLPTLRTLSLIAWVAWLLVRLIRQYEAAWLARRQESRSTADPTTVHALLNLGTVVVILTAALVAVQEMGLSISGILAFGGIGGLAVGFAAKDMLANFFGGLVIYLDRPFGVGDWIRTPDRKIEGVVEQIGWRVTVIRTFDCYPVYVPNSTFTSSALENPSRMSHRKLQETLGLRYSDLEKMPVLTAAIRQMLARHPDVDPAGGVIVSLGALSGTSLEILVQCLIRHTDSEGFYRARQDILIRAHALITEHSANFSGAPQDR